MVRRTTPKVSRCKAVGIWLLLILGVAVAGAQTEPYIPANDSIVVERLPASLAQRREELRVLRARAALSGDLGPAVQLARQYIELGRAEMDPRYYGYAEAILAPWWNTAEPPSSVQLLRAVILQARHNFSAALADLDALLVRQPRNAQAWLTRAVILQVQGKPRLALQSCIRLANLVERLISTTCMASAAGRMGRGEASYRFLAKVLEVDARSDPKLVVWALTIQGDLAARLGRTRSAEDYFRRALALGVRDTRLLTSYADFLLDEGRATEAHEILAGETRSDALLLRVALAEQILDHPDLEAHLTTLKARMRAAGIRGDKLHLREAARAQLALLDNPALALNLALDNWSIQREPRDARIVLESALATRQPEAAQPVLDWLTETGLESGRLAPLIRQLSEVRNDL